MPKEENHSTSEGPLDKGPAVLSCNTKTPFSNKTTTCTTKCILHSSAAAPTLSWWPTTSNNNNHFTKFNKGPIILQLLLPLLIVFLLPTIKLDYHQDYANVQTQTDSSLPFGSSPLLIQAPNAFLTLIKLPLDRLRFSVGLMGGVGALQVNERQDLQEEETMQLISPGEHQVRGQVHHYGHAAAGPQYVRQQQGQMMRAPPQRATTAQEMAGVYPPHAQMEQAEGPSGGGADIISAPNGADQGPVDQAAPQGTAIEGGEGAHAPSSGAGLQTRGDLPAVRALNVKCEKNHMTVNIVFDRPFYGLVFSKGHYNDQKCVHLPANSGQTSVSFDIHLGKCGMSSSDASGNPNALLQHQQQLAASGASQQQQPTGLYIENTIIIQYDPQVQEIYDQARKLRCTWYDYYEKSVTFRPYNVDMLDAVTANFLGDNIQCWMQIQVGKGPWSSEVAGIVKIGQTMTMVLAIKDDENRFDMLVRNCVAHDGKHPPIQLVDEYGCVARPKIMGKFQKVRNFGPAATVVSYAHFQAFKFPDSMSVHFQCVIQVCRYECPEPACNGSPGQVLSSAGSPLNGVSGHLAGSASTDQSSAGDYTASGTEIVAAKEAVPGPGYLTNGSMYGGGGSGGQATAVGAIKLDQEAQLQAGNRVQVVKLDTSMMAGAGGGRPSSGSQSAVTSSVNGGPLPPHLLHTAASQDSPSSTSYAAPPTRGTYASVGPSFARGQPARPLSIGPPGGAPALNGRPPMLTVRSSQAMAPSNRGPGQFSSPYQMQTMTSVSQPHHHQLQQRSSPFSHRSGDSAAPDDDGLATPGSAEELQQVNQQQAGNPLSLIASPRGMRVGVASATGNHRERRAANHLDLSVDLDPLTNSSSGARAARALGQTTTDIRTQKSIQVVSPDDVAFSLMGPNDESLLSQPDAFTGESSGGYLTQRPAGYSSHRRGVAIQQQVVSNVCFSATKLMLAILVTLVALAVSIVIVAYVVIKQRARLANEKLAGSIYQVATPVSSECHQQRQVQQDLLLAARQREEMQQRNNCLARLYSQFVPANYWRNS